MPDNHHVYLNSDYLFYEIGVNLISINSIIKRPKEEWKHWQNEPMTKELYEQQKHKGDFDDGYAIITGNIWRGPYQGKYLLGIDIDNHEGLEEILTFYPDFNSISELATKTMIVQHEDAKDERAHIYFITSAPIPKRFGISGVNKTKDKTVNVPAIEVKSNSSTCIVGPGSIHKNGHLYSIIGTKDIQVLNEEETAKLNDAMKSTYEKYSTGLQTSQIKSENQSSINHSILSDELRDIARSLTINGVISKISEGSRNSTLISFTRSLLNYHYKSKDLEILKNFIFQVNKQLCDPPLPQEEVENIWNQDLTYLQKDLANDEKKYSRNEIQINYDCDKLFEKIPEKKFAEYIINTAKKTIKREDSLIRLILYSGLSAYTKDPLNLGIVAPTSEGKTYAVSEVMKLLPRHDVWMLGNMSPKVLIRDRGILVDEDNQPIQEKIQELNKKIRKEEDKDRKNEFEEQRKSLYENSKMLIDLSNRVLVFLEPPHAETWTILKPILSHDTFEIEHPYVYKADKSLEVKHVVTRGWPACIFCSAKDDSSWSMWPEIQSRFFIASPNMIKQKYQDSNILIAQKKGLPFLVQEQLIVSNEDLKIAMKCVSLLKKQLLLNHDNSVWIPYGSILSQSVPSEKGPDVRITNRIFSLLNLITKINFTNRPKLVYGNETLAISLLSDLEEVLKLTHNLTGIPSYKIEFFTGVFIPLYLTKKNPLEKDNIIEDKIAVYTNELSDYYKEKTNKILTTDAIKKTYLVELKNNGLIDDFQSIVDKRKNGYYPIIDVKQFNNDSNRKCINYTNQDEGDNNIQFFKLKLSNNYNKIEKDWLNIEILNLIKYGIGQTNIFKLIDETDNELCICRFVKKYDIFANLNRYFQTDEYCIYSSKIFGKIIKL